MSTLTPDDRTLNCSLWRNGSNTELEISRVLGDALEEITEQRAVVNGDRLDTVLDIGLEATVLRIAAFDFGGSAENDGEALFFNPEPEAMASPKPEMILSCQSQRPPLITLGEPTGPLTVLTGQAQFFSILVDATTPTDVVCRTSSTTPEITLGDIDLELYFADPTNTRICETRSDDWEEECSLDVHMGAGTYLTAKLSPFNDMEGILLTCEAIPSTALEFGIPFGFNLTGSEAGRTQTFVYSVPEFGATHTRSVDCSMGADPEGELTLELYETVNGDTSASNLLCQVETTGAPSNCIGVLSADASSQFIVTATSFGDSRNVELVCDVAYDEIGVEGEVSAEYNVTAEVVPETVPTDDTISLFDAGFGDDDAADEADVSVNVTGEVDVDSILEGGPGPAATEEGDAAIEETLPPVNDAAIEETLPPANDAAVEETLSPANASVILDEVFDLLDDGNSTTGVLEEVVDVLDDNTITIAPDESLNVTSDESTSPSSDNAADDEEDETAATNSSAASDQDTTSGAEGNAETSTTAAVSSSPQTLTHGGWVVTTSAFIAASSFWL